MTRHNKLIERLRKKPMDFTYSELITLLSGFGYHEIKTGKTSGSARAFFHERSRHLIRLHRPHPGQVLKVYQVKQILEELKKEELI